MFLTRTRLYLLPMQPPARLEHIFSEDLGEVSANKIPTLAAHTNLHGNIMYPYIQNTQSTSAHCQVVIDCISDSQYSFLRVIFKNTEIIAPLNTTVWSVWQEGDPRTGNVYFADFNTTGVSVASRPNFSTELSQRKAATFSIASAVGKDYKNWVDVSYIV